MLRRLALIVVAAGFVWLQTPLASQTQGTPGAQSPNFRSSVEVTTLDVTVIDSDGVPLTDLRSPDFTVRIDGKTRRVIRAEWVPLARPTTTLPPPPPPDGYSSNEASTSGRLIVIAIDQPNIRADGAAGLRSAVNAFIDRLEPSDRLAAVALGGGISTPFTPDRASVKEAIARMSGDMRPVTDIGISNLTGSEAIEIIEGSPATLQAVIARECLRTRPPDPTCPAQIAMDAQAIASSLRQGTDRTLLALQALFDGLRKIDSPKTVVLVSEGFAMGSQSGAVLALGSLAAAARTSVYGLRLDDRVFDASNRRATPLGPSDRHLRFAGLDLLASVSKGGVFDVVATGSSAFQRLEREISGYYLVGVESVPADSDGKTHPISVQVGRRGAIVRARRELADAAVANPTRTSPLEMVASALSTPLVVTGLPVHVAAFSLRDEDPSKIQVLIHADIGKAYVSAAAVTLGYVISDSAGQIVVHKVGDGRLAPPSSAPAPLALSVTASLVPGEYMLKLAVTEGGRVGSVEHPIHAGLIDVGRLKLSELVIGGPADTRDSLRPTIGYDINFGGVQGYIEAYGNGDDLLMRYEIAPTLEAPPVRSAVVPGRSTGDGLTIFSYIMPVRDLPPGSYYLRATLSSASATLTPLKRIARAFRVLPAALTGGKPAPATSSAASTATAGRAPAIATATLVRPFRREEAVQAETLQRFLEILEAPARADFDAGIAALTAGDFVKAELSFKNAQRATSATGNSTTPLTYLAATYAASGHDLEAASVWQTALFDGFEYPQIYEWLAEALIRVRNFEQAQSILKEAIEKWPKDTRFTTRLAALQQAAAGQR
jgi:VWFA-related protein